MDEVATDGDHGDVQYNAIDQMLGKTMVRVEKTVYTSNDAVVMEDDAGTTYTLTHCQDCCESVDIEDVCGDLSDLVGSPLTMAEEATQNGEEAGLPMPSSDESSTWTFYKFATVKGYVTIRFFGSSNGYYGEGVSLIVEASK